MTYPSQPGYPTPQYGGQSPQPQQQNNLWLIGGAVLTVLIIIMTVILLVVQRTQGSDSTDGDGGGSTDGASSDTETDGGGDTDGGDSGGDGLEAVEMTADACDAFDMTMFEEVYGSFDPAETYKSASNSGGLGSLSCTFYNAEYTSIYLTVSDYETPDDAAYWVESDADYYNAEAGYEFSEYTDYGDVGSMYSSSTDNSSKSIYLHVAVGSLEIKANTTLYSAEEVEEQPAIDTMADFLVQSGELFADYQ
ncbi:hypothetical protein [Glycomyces rhizosphaerae]|uniref:DUF3558 domain-containing protein n=1 Tax=Glycomyces rhizosphaerae TaxID=2054422 RepID=A0ABV7PQW8_9ACTN